jgi:hypothetical protein
LYLVIKSENRKLEGFNSFWAKQVDDFNDQVHCINCLVGPRFKEVQREMITNIPIKIDVPLGAAFYICGVSGSMRWRDNFHLVVVCDEESKAGKKTYTGDLIVLFGGRELPIDGKYAKQFYQAKGHLFYTCRNFQFGVQYFGKGRNPVTEGMFNPKKPIMQPSLRLWDGEPNDEGRV